jgi:hypothetical protein
VTLHLLCPAAQSLPTGQTNAGFRKIETAAGHRIVPELAAIAGKNQKFFSRLDSNKKVRSVTRLASSQIHHQAHDVPFG